MKRFFLMLQLSLIVFQLFFSTTAKAATIQYWLNFASFRDEYRLDFQWPTGTATYKVLFVSPTNVPYNLDFNNPPTGILYLTCNGTYAVEFYDSGSSKIGNFQNIVTTAIVNPTCSSYPDQTGTNGLNATATDNGNGTYDLSWTPKPGADKYEIYKDGQKIGETTGTNYTLPSSGAVTVVARDANGNIIGQSDLHAPSNGAVDNEPGTGSCNGCTFLKELLECPDWDTYMGELTGAIQAALPPPPDWDAIADKIGAATISHLSNYLGPVPEPPTQSEIDSGINTSLPTVDSSSPDATNLVPTVPAGYEQPKPFDITSGPQIEIVDESQPFTILDPLHNIQYDEPGVPVIPGDSRNNTGGIQKPVNQTLPIPKPAPTYVPELPNNPVPIPSSSPGSGPNPNGTGGAGPIPIWKGD